MKYLSILPLLFFTLCLNAQQHTAVVNVSEADDHFTFTVRVDDRREQQLVDAFSRISETDVNRKFRGPWQITTPDGIEVALNTRRGKLSVRYRGQDDAVLAKAAAKAEVIREFLNIQDTPEPPSNG